MDYILELFKNIYNEYYGISNNVENGEKYIAPLYNYMIKKNMNVTISNVEKEKVHVLGTPEELEIFING